MSHEITSEFETMDLGDSRLDRRARKLLGDLAADPAASVNAAAGGWAETRAACRLFDNDRATPEKLLAPHVEATKRRVAREDVVLVLQDTTELDLTAHPPDDAGVLNTEGRFGLFDHTHLAVTPERLCLGVLGADLFGRTPESLGRSAERESDPLETKESHRWLEGYRLASRTAGECPGTQVVSVADREGDLYDVFVEADRHPTPAEFVVRARADRSLPERDPDAGPWAFEKVRREVEQSEVRVVRQAELPRTHKRAARRATLEVRATTVRVKPPHARGQLPEVTLDVVLVQEVGGPGDGSDVCWLLVTSLPVDSVADVLRVVDYYAARWAVEVYFRTLKSGCRVEELRLEKTRRLKNALMFYKVVAWRVMHLTFLGRECPELPCEAVFSQAEWKSVWKVVTDAPLPEQPPTLAEFVPLLASLGGYNNRPGEGPPGPQAIWVGVRRMTDFALAWQAFGPPDQT